MRQDAGGVDPDELVESPSRADPFFGASKHGWSGQQELTWRRTQRKPKKWRDGVLTGLGGGLDGGRCRAGAAELEHCAACLD